MNETFGKVIEQGVFIQQSFPGLELVAVGGTAAAIHCNHRLSIDVDSVTSRLKSSFDDILDELNNLEGWKTARFTPPVLVLGSRFGVDIGLRQLRDDRLKPIEKTIIHGLQIPTIEDTLRIKAYLMIRRRAIRDFVDVVALSDKIGKEGSTDIILSLDEYYKALTNLSLAHDFAQAGMEDPVDLKSVSLRDYKGIQKPYDRTEYIIKNIRELCEGVAESLLLCDNEQTPKTRNFKKAQGGGSGRSL